jgi:ribosomal protein S18 acetylase RimI-like enzyme
MGVVSWRRFYGEFLRRHLPMAARAFLSSLRGGRWRRLLGTSRYAASGALPPAELVSIALEPEIRGTGIGAELVRQLLEEFAARRVNAVRVTAGGSNLQAQQLYERMGFHLRSNMEIHKGEKAAVYVITLDSV